MSAPVMPRSVQWFERLAWLAMALTLASAPLNWPTIHRYFAREPVVFSMALIVFFSVQAFWIWLVARGRKNWARWVSLVWTVAGFVQPLFEIETRFRNGAAAALAYYGICLLWLIAVSLLFLPDARPWFHAPPRAEP